MSPPLITGLALAGLLLGWPIRAIIFRYAVPSGDPPRTACPACGYPPEPVPGQPTPTALKPTALKPTALGSAALKPTALGSAALGSAALKPTALGSAALGRRSRPPGVSGRCPACQARTGPPWLAVAVTTAIVLAALAARVHPGLVLAAACWLAACAVALAFIDAAVRRLPDLLIVPAYVGTTALLLAAAAGGAKPALVGAAGGGYWPVLLRAFLGGLALAGFYLALLLVSPSAMGLGDVKLAASLGTMLAWFGWRTLIAGGFAGFALAGLYGVALLVTHRATRKQQIPFGPFMIAGAFLVILI